MVRFGVPGMNVDTLAYADSRLSVVPVVQAAREPLTTDKKYPIWCEWRIKKNPSTGAEGDFWKLVKFDNVGDAIWVKFSPGGGGTSFTGLEDQVGTDVDPDGATDRIKINGLTVAANANPSSIPLESVAGTNVLTLQIQVSKARSGAPGNKNDAGLSSYETTQFSVDADGYVTLKGGTSPPILQLQADDLNTATANGSGIIAINATTVANATNATPLYTEIPSSNALNIDLQVSTAITVPADKNDAGISSYNSSHFTVDSNGWVESSQVFTPQYSNLSIAYSGGTFTVQGYDGTALSSSNKAIIWLQDKDTPGQLVKYEVSANQTFTDGAAGTVDNQLFNLTTGIDAANDIPFYLYAVGNDAQDTIAFMISRIPHRKVAPASASIGQSGAVVNVGQGDFFSLRAITVGDYDGNPCLSLGSFRMQLTGATDSWTVQTLANTDGIGQFNDDTLFTVSRSQYGADTGKYIKAGGTTTPDVAGSWFTYTITRDGIVRALFDMSGVTTAGVGTNNLAGALPYISKYKQYGSGLWVAAGGSPGSILATLVQPDTNSLTAVMNQYSGGIGNLVTSNVIFNDMGATSSLRCSLTYQSRIT